MANEIAILNARNFIRQGGQFGNYTATSYELQGDRVILVAECKECGAKNRIQWSNVSAEQRTPGILPCVNRAQHKAVAKSAAPDWRQMSDADFKAYVRRLPSDEYLRMSKNAEFAARDAAMPNKYIDRKEAIAQKEAADREAKTAPHRKMFLNAWHAHEHHNLRQPFLRLEGWLALSEAERQAIIQRFDLTNVDYTPNLDRMLGVSM